MLELYTAYTNVCLEPKVHALGEGKQATSAMIIQLFDDGRFR